jgi:prepilin-type N-terminal cleavage/methylation domain-containing protein
MCSPKGLTPSEARTAKRTARGFTLIELLVVIALVALLLALLFPVLRSARELGQRAVCLSNLRQLTLAWTAYAEEHDGWLVYGVRGTMTSANRAGKVTVLKGWVGTAFDSYLSRTRAELIANPDKGALWRWIKDVDIYRCPRAQAGTLLTYGVVASANGGTQVPGTFVINTFPELGVRVGSTVLKLTRLTDIISPGAGQRAVFIDAGEQNGVSGFFYVDYLHPIWKNASPPIQHCDGVTLSMADGHAEYWKWKGRETVEDVPQHLSQPPVFVYEPQTEDGLYDLQRLQRATWGRLGY